jgi:hypothetical protein
MRLESIIYLLRDIYVDDYGKKHAGLFMLCSKTTKKSSLILLCALFIASSMSERSRVDLLKFAKGFRTALGMRVYVKMAIIKIVA